MKPVFKTFMCKAQTGEDGTTTVIASTPAPDRMGDIVSPDWNLERYAANGIVAWAHDYSIPPIGRTVGLTLEGDTLVARIKWDDDPDRNPLGATVAHQYKEGYLSACSVGFAPGKSTPRNELDADDPRYAKSGSVFTQNELLEISAVAIPANAECVAIRAKAYGLDTEPVQRHILNIEEDSETLTVTMAKEPAQAEPEEPEEEDTDEQLGLWDEPTAEPVQAGMTDDEILTAKVRAAVLDLFGNDPAVVAAIEPDHPSTVERCGLSALFDIDPTEADPV